MKKNITFTIDQEIVDLAKAYAKKHDISVSSMVEEMLWDISSGTFPKGTVKIKSD
tara:strand:+ start:118 stop:282 length:165 start_codon:yes stop_codon:yes gene_type:complete